MLLSLAIWIPIAAGLLVLACGDARKAVRWIALAGALLGFLVTIPLYTQFQSGNPGIQFEQLVPWIERFNINYHLGVDGISVLFLLLNSFVTVLVVIDGLLVNGTARLVGWFASVVRLFQTGFVYQYAFTMLIGVVILAFWFLKK